MEHNLVFSGGGLHTIAFIGSIKYLTEINQLDNIKNVLGSSGGSIIALMFVLNIPYTRMIELMIEINKLYKEQKIHKLGFNTITNVYNNLGVFGNEFTHIVIDKIFNEKNMSNNITFLELTKLTGKNLIISVSNLTQNKIEYISINTYPEMSVKTAIDMSTAIPIIFKPIKYYNDLYVDSLVFNNFPIDYFQQSTFDTLGLKIKQNNNNDNKITFTKYLYMLFKNIIYKKDPSNFKICTINIENHITNFDLYNFKFVIDDESIYSLINSGYDALKVFLTKTL